MIMFKKSELEAKRVNELREIADDLGIQTDGLLKPQIIEMLLANSEDNEDSETEGFIDNKDELGNEEYIEDQPTDENVDEHVDVPVDVPVDETAVNTEVDTCEVELNPLYTNSIEQPEEYIECSHPEIQSVTDSSEDYIEISTERVPYLQTLNRLHPLFAKSDKTEFIHQIDGLVKVIEESSSYQKVECFLPGRGNVTGYIFK